MILVFFVSILLFLILFLLLATLLVVIVDRSIRSRGYQGPLSDHFDGTIFLNIKDAPVQSRSPRLSSILRWMLSRQKNVWEQRSVAQTKPGERVLGKELVVTFINHATVLIQTEGVNIITDPVYSERASPFSFAGPRRFINPGVSFEDLPKIDTILISHNHYDHLDLATLSKLAKRDQPRIIAPLGNKPFLELRGIPNVSELDWWESNTVSEDISIECVPAQHFSSRALTDRNKTLWSGYVIKTSHGDVYFAGDTGTGPFIDQIAKRFPSGFRLGLLPIGAFRPEWFMKEVHISPDEAYAIQSQLKVQDAVGIHFGTFKLADDAQDEPVERIAKLIKESSIPNRFHILPNGVSLTLH
jgi:L-ascorbate metabolism protein UlaG (beta-lactamase superfamily)